MAKQPFTYIPKDDVRDPVMNQALFAQREYQQRQVAAVMPRQDRPWDSALDQMFKGSKVEVVDITPEAQIMPTPANEDLDRLMFHFFTPLQNRMDDAQAGGRDGQWEPSFDSPIVPVVGDPPATDEREYQISIGVRLPQYDEENFWSIPFEVPGTVCLPELLTQYTVLNYTVPSDRLIVIEGISYECTGFSPFEVLRIQVYVSGTLYAEFDDINLDPTANPADQQWGLASHKQPFPVYIRADHDQTITVMAILRGVYPYTTVGPVNRCIKVLLHGWMASLMDNRDGGPRPVDAGDLVDMCGINMEALDESVQDFVDYVRPPVDDKQEGRTGGQDSTTHMPDPQAPTGITTALLDETAKAKAMQQGTTQAEIDRAAAEAAAADKAGGVNPEKSGTGTLLAAGAILTGALVVLGGK